MSNDDKYAKELVFSGSEVIPFLVNVENSYVLE